MLSHTLTFRDGRSLRITFYRANIVHVAVLPPWQTKVPTSWGFCARPDRTTETRLTESAASVEFATTQLAVAVDRLTGLPRITRLADGALLLDALSLQLTPAVVSGEETHHLAAEFAAPADEDFYGLGQHQDGQLNHRGQVLRMWHDYEGPNREGEITAVPFLLSSRGYAFLLDNTSRTTVACGVAGRTTWNSEVADAASFFLVAGAPDEIYAGYRYLTGETPLPPKSAVGYIQCKQRYRSQDELLEVARAYRAKGYPCDMLIVDWFHWKTLGDLALDKKFWPDPAAMNAELNKAGFRVMISCWPRFMKESRHYAALEAMGGFMTHPDGSTVYGTPDDPRGAVIDTTDPAVREWYWNAIRVGYGALGFDSWWLDEDEPDVCPHPFHFHAGTGARLHNIYPLTHTEAVYKGHRRDRLDRCLILSRSAWFGAQRHGTTFWSSDIHPTWDFFRRQIPTGLNFCASGFAWWSSDIGGWQQFPGQKEEAPPPAGYEELYVRWFQYGAFCPTFRAHGTRPQNEVWSYGADAERICVKYLNLRYQLLPYLYALAWRTRQTGAPFMRPLVLDFPSDPAARDVGDQYMFGPAFLVAPVAAKGSTRRKVYLPAGADWYDYWTEKRFKGGQEVDVEAPLDTLPLFVRAGSVVPHGRVVPHAGIPQNEIELRVYEGADGAFELYDDDGFTYAYEKGEYRSLAIRWDDRAKQLAHPAPWDGLTLTVRRIGG